MRRYYNEWMIGSVKELTPAGKVKRPSYETVISWVNASWSAVDIGLIRRSFKCCGIPNNRNGTEDKLIFDYESLETQSEVGNNVEILENDSENMEEIEHNYYSEQEMNCPNVWV